MNKPVFSRPPLLIGIGGTTRPGSSTERALAAALAHARTLGAQTQLFGGAELA
ncbi:NADPH-dependent FMN reductase, partial [Klebsiella pneumoniae]